MANELVKYKKLQYGVFPKSAIRRLKAWATFRAVVRAIVYALIIAWTITPVVLALSTGDYFVYSMAGVLMWAALLIFMIKFRALIFSFITGIEVTCPSCNELTLMNRPWICGFCKGKNRNWITMTYPVLKCSVIGCEDRHQTAYQCPECSEHIKIDVHKYFETKSNKEGYVGVARFVHDTSAPVVNPKHSTNLFEGID